MLLLYLGPEVLMPLASVFAAIGGALLMFWNKIVGGVRILFGRPAPEEAEASPETEAMASTASEDTPV